MGYQKLGIDLLFEPRPCFSDKNKDYRQQYQWNRGHQTSVYPQRIVGNERTKQQDIVGQKEPSSNALKTEGAV